MNGPSKYGAIIYSSNIKRLSQFYVKFFNMSAIKETDELISLVKDGFNIVIHVPPADVPKNNFNSVKLFLAVDSLASAREAVTEYGGKSLSGEWSNSMFKVCNVVDPDGNHVQIREFTP